MAEKSSSRNEKKRNWACVFYPESLPDTWLDTLKSTGLKIAISPLHDKDIDPTGLPKKAHYHIIMHYDGPTTYNVVKKFTDSLNQPKPEPLHSVVGAYRYLVHADNPDKYQYDKNDIQLLNGFNLYDFCEMTKSEVLAKKKELQAIVRELNIFEYADLLDYLVDNDLSELYDVASSHTLFMDKYISSRRNKAKAILAQSSNG